MEENIVIAPNPSQQTSQENIVIAPSPENIVISPNPVISPANHTILIGQQNEGWWNGNFLPNEHLAKFLDGLMTAQEVGILFSDNNGSKGLINLFDGLGLVNMQEVGGFDGYTQYLTLLSGVNVDQYDMLTLIGAWSQTAPQILPSEGIII